MFKVETAADSENAESSHIEAKELQGHKQVSTLFHRATPEHVEDHVIQPRLRDVLFI